MKILFTSKKQRAFVKSIPTFNIIEALRLKVNVKDLHVLADDGSTPNAYQSPPLEYNYKFFEDYKTDNIIEILEKERPDVIVSSNDYDYFGRAFILAAKFKKIPTVLLLQGIFADIYLVRSEYPLIRDRYTILKNRGRFILKKFWLLLKTYKRIGYGLGKIFQLILDDIITPFLYSEPSGKYRCDLILVRTEDDMRVLQKRGIRSKIVVTGDPELDSIYNIVSNYKFKHAHHKSRMKTVLLTTAMVEHGHWTKKMWEETIKQIVTIICTKFTNEIDLVLKIHPTSERIQDYQSLLKRIGYAIPIFQTENLVDILSDADIVLTIEGGSWANWVALFLEKPLIIVNVVNDKQTEKFPYIKEGIAFELKDINELKNLILKIKTTKYDKEKIDKFIAKYLFKFDGKASERSAYAILELVKNYKLLNK